MSKIKEQIVPLYRFINHIASINYSAQRIYEQSKKANSNSNSTFSQNWITSKTADIAEARDNFLLAYNTAKQQSYANIDEINNQLNISSTTLLNLFNFYYGKSIEFNQLFDGFVCKDPNLAELINQFEAQYYIVEPDDQDTFTFVSTYEYYISSLFSSMITNSTIDIVDQLAGDINDNGVPAFRKGIVDNPNLIKLSSSDIGKLRNKVIDYSNKLKKFKPQKNIDKDKFYINYNKTSQKYYDLEFFFNQLVYRLQSANKDFNESTIHKTIESAMDFLSSTKKEKPLITEIYVSKLEMNYIQYLQNILNSAIKNLENISKPIKEKE